MSDSIILARLKRSGKTFELSIDPHKAVEFIDGKASLVEALMSDEIFTDAGRAQVASTTELEAAFQTTNKTEIAKIILSKGEIQSTSDQRAKEREQKLKQLIYKIHSLAVDPKTDLPHPITRVEAALQQAKVQLKDHKSIDDQFDEIISKLRPIIPIKIELKTLQIIIAGQYVGALNHYIRNQKLIKEEWTNDGSWQVTIEVPAGLVPEVIDLLNSKTSGSCQVTFKE